MIDDEFTRRIAFIHKASAELRKTIQDSNDADDRINEWLLDARRRYFR